MFRNISDKAKGIYRDPLGSAKRFIKKRTGSYLTESQYNQLSALTNQLAIDYNVNKVIEKYGANKEELVKEFLIQRNIINYTLNSIYSRRLKYLEDKLISDPRNADTKQKKDVIEKVMEKLNVVLNSINAKLQELDPDNVIRDKLMAEAKSKYGTTDSYTSSYSVTRDPSFWLLMQGVDFRALLEGIGYVLSGIGNVFGGIIMAILTGGQSGGVKRIKTIKRTKCSKRRHTRRCKH
jgi:hypothetical protein